ncbi:MAG: DUF447 family protein [Gammaproteobacteria bacterium]|nr:DUF447 family protein [Gammaproteobacteria bacterium]MDH5592134.1 DUF447 family protein [Gammaproteobacteria bacterium]
MAQLESKVHEVIVTTLDHKRSPHSAPMGISEVNGHFLIKPFKPSQTYDNLKQHRQCSISYTDDVRVFAGSLTGRREWPTQPCQHIEGQYLKQALAHTELEIIAFDDDDPRACFTGALVTDVNHASFRGFNRAQSAVIEAAVLVSRLTMLPVEKIQQEIAYLSIAIEKTAGPREREAWGWLMTKINEAGIELDNE